MPRAAAPHVVVLDRSPAIAAVYRGRFAIEGYRVTSVGDAAPDPLRVLALAPDLVLLDLPSGEGPGRLAFLRRLRREPAGRALPVVCATPVAELDLGRHGGELAALGVVLPPRPDYPAGRGHLDGLVAAAAAELGRAREEPRPSGAERLGPRITGEERATA
jgi:CheY-like chemotaxis protein